MIRKVNIVLFFLMSGICCRAQQDNADITPKLVGSLNFIQYIGGVVMINAHLDTISTPLNFILDTGSGGISLDSSTCNEFNIPGTLTDTFVLGIGGERRVKFVFNQTLYLGKVKVDSLNFHINDYTELSQAYGFKIDGIIGYSFLKDYIVKINYDNKLLEIYTPGKIIYPKGGHLLHPKFQALPIQTAELRDNRKINFPFYFDTGAGLALLLSNEFADDSSIIKRSRKPVVTSVNGMLGKAEMRLTVIKKLKLGPYTFRMVPTYLYEDGSRVTRYPKTGGLLGSEIFRRFNLIINYPEKEIHLLPNTHFNDFFDYSYTGMSLYLKNGVIQVEEIIPGSPAAEAGIKKGDEVYSIGSNFSQNLESYINSLQVVNTALTLIVKRNGVPTVINLKTSSIIN